jgi:PAS domain S-box-containing protein
MRRQRRVLRETLSSLRNRLADARSRAASRPARSYSGERNDEVFRALVENTPDLIARFDRDLRRCYVNPAIERLTGVPASRLIGKTLSEMHFDERFIGIIEGALRAAFDEGKETTVEVLLPSASGERVFQARIVPERDLNGQIVFAMVISRDITDVRRDEERLRLLKSRIELLLTSTYEGICAVNPAGSVTFMNPSGGALLGYSPDELVGRNIHELLHADRDDHRPEDCPLVAGTPDNKRQHLVDQTLRRKDGSSLAVEMFVSPLCSEDGQVAGVVASFVDVTERNALKAELELANRLAGLGRVASSMSHEFNNVLMGIQPFGEVVARTSGEPRIVDAATRILQSVKRGRAITEGLRAYTRPPEPVRVDTEIGSWLAARSIELRRLVAAGVELDIRGPERPAVASIDSGQMTQVLAALVLNASEAIGGREGRIAVEATVRQDESGDNTVRITVRDNGRGLANEELSKVFEPFFTTRPGGRGLGLSIAQQIVSRHDGTIALTSELGRGTSADIVLNARIVREVQSPPRAARGSLPQSVLLIEDDEPVADGIRMLLADEGVLVDVAGSGAAALLAFADRLPQALVIDINLPDCDGFELYERLAASSRLPVVFISGHADEILLSRGDALAGARLLSKPFEVDALLDALSAVTAAPTS